MTETDVNAFFTDDLFVDGDEYAPTGEVDPAVAYARLQADYDALHDKLESYVWDNSNSINRIRQSTRRLERETTRRLELEEELRMSTKLEAIGQLAAGVAHEINTPVQYVRDNTVFIAEAFGELCAFLDDVVATAEASAADPDGSSAADLAARILAMRAEADLDFVLEEVPSAIGQSQEGLERVTKIVKSMKDFSHPGSDAMTAFDVNGALDSIRTVTTSEWKYVAELDLVPGDEGLTAHCYAGEINQVLVNLVVNASHAVAERREAEPDHNGRIELGARRRDDRLEIWITDNGSGIPDDIRERVFDPFFTTKDVGKGTGQGLALVHGVIVNKHAGSIRLDSTVGVGTTFTLDIPIDGPPERKAS